jgi:hypothetical protein
MHGENNIQLSITLIKYDSSITRTDTIRDLGLDVIQNLISKHM